MPARRSLVILGALAVIAVGAALIVPQGLRPASATGGVLAVTTGENHTCAVTADAGAKCWGFNLSGNLGDGTIVFSRTTPVDVCASGSSGACGGGSTLTEVAAISAGSRLTCALTLSGGVKCWGDNEFGQLGDGTTDSRSNPADVCASGSGAGCSGGSPLADVTAISVGAKHTCALMSDSGIKCWGDNTSGRLGDGSTTNRSLPVSVCRIDVGPLPPLSSGSPTASGIGLPCVALSGFSSVSAGRSHNCALTTVGGVKCWGGNGSGALGDGSTTSRTTPGDVMSGSSFSSVSANGQNTCAVTTTGGLKCWGGNFSGQVGDGTTSFRTVPTDVCMSGSGAGCSGGEPIGGVSAVTSGEGHACAVIGKGSLMCWGRNDHGQLGDSTTTDRLNPVFVSGLTSEVVSISGGFKFTCAVTGVRGLRCWGDNITGKLGDGTETDRHAPVDVSGFGPKPTATSTDTPPPTATSTDTPPPTATSTDTPSVPTDTPEPGATNTPVPPANGLVGDVDCSGSVTAIDAALILQFVAGLLGTLPCPENADTNGDGDVSSVDAALILQFSAGLIGSLPP